MLRHPTLRWAVAALCVGLAHQTLSYGLGALVAAHARGEVIAAEARIVAAYETTTPTSAGAIYYDCWPVIAWHHDGITQRAAPRWLGRTTSRERRGTACADDRVGETVPISLDLSGNTPVARPPGRARAKATPSPAAGLVAMLQGAALLLVADRLLFGRARPAGRPRA